MDKLFYNTTNPFLLDILKHLMTVPEFNVFRLVGGTALSLQRGHRISVDIDFFTDVEYGSLDFTGLENILLRYYPCVDSIRDVSVGMGKTYYVGKNKDNSIKIDLYYTDPFIENFRLTDGIRLATVNEILAMKMDVISRRGRKKDFWDLHELIKEYTLAELMELHKKRYPYSHDSILLLNKLTDFSQADEDFDPVCMLGKHWEIIKLDILEFVNEAPKFRGSEWGNG